MATNLISLVMQFMTPDVIARIASALGLDQGDAKKAITASVPALLAGLAGLAAKPGGARQLSDALSRQQPGVIESVKNIIGGPAEQAFVDTGSNALSSLLGSFTMRGLAGSIARFAGTSESASRSLLGMLGPVVLGALGQQQRSMGLDANGITDLLTSQQGQIVQAIPSGLADELDGAGLLDLFDGSARNTVAAATASVRRFGQASERTIDDASQSAYATRSAAASLWPFGLAAGLVLLAALAWYFVGNHGDERVAEAPASATQPSDQPRATVGLATQNLVVGGLDLSRQVNSSLSGLTAALTGITDVASAQDALPKIRDATAQLDRINTLAAQLPADGKRALARLIAAAMPAINQLCDKALAVPGVGGVAKPAIDELRERLDSIARA
jgi:hypothetical protein